MNKLYALLACVLMSSFSIAQTVQSDWPSHATFSKDQITQTIAPRGENPIPLSSRATDILFEDFQAGSPDLPTGWMTSQVTSNPDGSLAGALIDAFIVGDATSADAGGYWPVPDFPGNLFAQANDDNDPCDCDMIQIELTSPEVSLVGASNPVISFDLFHDKGFGGGDGGVQVSTDGGGSWITLVEVLPDDPSVWQTIFVDINDFVGETSFTVKFFWSDNGSWASGFAIDNVGIGSLPNFNLVATKSSFGDWNIAEMGPGIIRYSQIPVSQASPVSVSAVAANYSANDLADVTFNVEVFQDGTSQGVWGADQTYMTPSLETDTLSAQTDYTPTLGTVTYDVTVTNSTGDDNAADDMSSGSMEVTEFTYARDANSAEAFIGLNAGDQYGNLFDIYSDVMVGGVDVAIGNGSLVGATFHCWIYDVVGYDDTFAPIFGNEFYETVDLEIMDEDGDGNPDGGNIVEGNSFLTLPFLDGAIQLSAGKTYLAVVTHDGSDGDVVMPVSGNNVQPGTWGDLGDGWGWYLSIAMVRLNMDASVAVNNTESSNFSLGQNMPNPVSDVARINYELGAAATVNFRVVDITGRIVFEQNMGTQMSGTHTLEVDVTAFNAGVYTYTLTAGNMSAAKQMIVK